MNNVILMGRLTRDAELRYTPSGKPVCQLTMAVQRNYKNKEGNKRWITEVIANKFDYIENKNKEEGDFEKAFGENKTVPINYDEEIPF